MGFVILAIPSEWIQTTKYGTLMIGTSTSIPIEYSFGEGHPRQLAWKEFVNKFVIGNTYNRNLKIMKKCK